MRIDMSYEERSNVSPVYLDGRGNMKELVRFWAE